MPNVVLVQPMNIYDQCSNTCRLLHSVTQSHFHEHWLTHFRWQKQTKRLFRRAMIDQFRQDVTMLGVFLIQGREHLHRSLKTMVLASGDQVRRGTPITPHAYPSLSKAENRTKSVKGLSFILSTMLLCIMPGNLFQRTFPPKPGAGSLLLVNIQN